MVFAGVAAVGGLLAVLMAGRDRLRGRGRLVTFAALGMLLIVVGGVLVRPEARGAVAVFAFVPLVGAFVLVALDLRASR
jgi:hypothetical protein